MVAAEEDRVAIVKERVQSRFQFNPNGPYSPQTEATFQEETPRLITEMVYPQISKEYSYRAHECGVLLGFWTRPTGQPATLYFKVIMMGRRLQKAVVARLPPPLVTTNLLNLRRARSFFIMVQLSTGREFLNVVSIFWRHTVVSIIWANTWVSSGSMGRSCARSLPLESFYTGGWLECSLVSEVLFKLQFVFQGNGAMFK